MHSQHIGIIGYGRFGRFWASILRPHHDVWVNDITRPDVKNHLPLAELCRKADVLFLCVPIGRLEDLLADLAPRVRPGTLIFDTASVKIHPTEQMQKHLGGVNDLTLVAAHPMFGPDSGRGGVTGLPMVTWFLSGDKDKYQDWLLNFRELGLRVVEMAPDEHDRFAAYSQGVTHYIGRVLDALKLAPTPIDTQGFSILLSLIEQTANDSWELFRDLQVHNPYTGEMRLRLETALDDIYAALLPDRADPDHLLVGVQGGAGSFSEEAALTYLAARESRYPSPHIRHLYTTRGVLQALHKGEIDYGVFAIQNAAGGVVMESIHALSQTNCRILDTFDIVVNHSIMHHPEIAFDQVDTLISHPQALAQCMQILQTDYAQLTLTSGEGDLIDQANCARALSKNLLPRTTAVLAPRSCARMFGLTLHADGLQDLGSDNLTTFAWAARA